MHLDDAAAVEAWFDRADGDRLVSIETRSVDLVDYTAKRDGAAVRQRFDQVRNALERLLPSGARPIVQLKPAEGASFFDGLRPEKPGADYSAFWPDEGKRRPASVQLKLAGLDQRKGYWRIVVANPQRQGQRAAAK